MFRAGPINEARVITAPTSTLFQAVAVDNLGRTNGDRTIQRPTAELKKRSPGVAIATVAKRATSRPEIQALAN